MAVKGWSPELERAAQWWGPARPRYYVRDGGRWKSLRSFEGHCSEWGQRRLTGKPKTGSLVGKPLARQDSDV